MTVLELISDEAGDERRRILLVASAAGLANAAVLALVNAVAGDPKGAGVGTFAMLVGAIALYVLGARYTYQRTTELVESALYRVKVRLVGEIERAELEEMERIGAGEINDNITENISIISDSAGLLANLLQSLCILVCGTFYLISISLPAFVLIVLVQGTGMALYLSKDAEVKQHLRRAARERHAFFEMLMDLLSGFKEVKFSRRRGQDVCEDLGRSAETLRTTKLAAARVFNDNWIFSYTLLLVLLGAIVFALPQQVGIESATLSKLVAAAMFIWGPVGALVGGFPAYTRCNIALSQIEVLEAKLVAADRAAADRAAAGATASSVDPWPGPISTIEARSLVYEYALENGAGAFRVGPVDLTIPAGEILFIVGGNGSGKSTLLRVLTGLYRPTSGALCADRIAVDQHSVAAYRERISSIFSDFHLFAKLYGLLGIDAAEVKRLIAQMQLQDKTSFERGQFTRRNLSTGQKKRLAMIIAMLEDRPLCVFDEWAADQDPEFRQYFYEELIPALRARGKTVIAVSHDDRYFRCADRVITMEYGQVRSIERIRRESRALPLTQGESPSAEDPNFLS